MHSTDLERIGRVRVLALCEQSRAGGPALLCQLERAFRPLAGCLVLRGRPGRRGPGPNGRFSSQAAELGGVSPDRSDLVAPWEPDSRTSTVDAREEYAD